MKTLLISPHFDDAVLSAGQYMAGMKTRCDVLTVFSEIPKDKGLLTPYDESCGFKTSEDAVVVRRDEDNQALAILGADAKYLRLLDSQYPGGSSKEDVLEALRGFAAQHGKEYDIVLAPLGLRHPDHVNVSWAANTVFGLSKSHQFYMWEDLPHRVTHPEEVQERLELIRTLQEPELTFIGDGPIADKVRALWCYKSQLAKGDLNPYVLYVPERFWKIS